MDNYIDDHTIDNQEALEELVWAIEASEGRFYIMLARCNYAYLQERLIQQAQEQCALDIRVIHLKQSDRTLYSTICAQLGQEMPAALMVSGLATVDNLDDMLRATNQVREEFRKNFPFPVILWINDAVHVKFLRIAPDFESWTTTTRFAIPTDELITVIQETLESLFATALAVNSSQSLYKLADVLTQGYLSCSELDLALKELPHRVQDLDPQLEAGLQFIRGLNGGDSPEALEDFQQSLTFWQQVEPGLTDNLSNQTDNPIQPTPINAKLKAGLVLFHIGLYHYRTTDRKKHQAVNWQTSKIHLQECLELFDQENRPDLMAKCITQLERVLQRMQIWDELEQVAQKALPLHQQYGSTSKLAQDYSFLAEVALQQQRWEDARQAAQQAETLITQLPKPKRWMQGLNLLFLAQAERQLANKQWAISHLVKARELGDFGHPLIYIRILEELRELYFEERQYLAAFATKQQRRSIEQQYGIRAFIGAGRLQPHREEASYWSRNLENLSPNLSPARKEALSSLSLKHQQEVSVTTDKQESVAPEIIASGRQRDLERLLERIGRNDCKLIVIHGRSGVGKSSLVNAGLVPALKQRVIGTQRNVPIAIRVYTNWIEELERQLLNEDESVETDLEDNRLEKPITSPPNLPYTKLLEQLRNDEQHQRRTVLIFDQFEEFFFAYTNPTERRLFWQFLADCLNILSVKVILSLREDYLHYLLECNRLDSMSVIGHDILGKNVLYELGNFSPTDARAIIEDLSRRSRFYLEPALIDQLVKDLAGTTGEILPIELQVVGAQLQAENIKTLAEYRELGTKEELVKRYLEEVVEDCGVENQQAAELVLYLLTDEKGTRPLKTRAELERDLEGLAADLIREASRLDWVLRIFVDSGLVCLLPETPYERYQLVHDYLAAFIRQQQQIGLLIELAEAKEKQKLTEAQLRQALKDKEEALQKEQQERQRTAIAEVEALSTLSKALFLSHDYLGALMASIKAGRKLRSVEVPSVIKTRLLCRLWEIVYSTKELNRFHGHSGGVLSVSFSPDDQTIASASLDGTVKLWRLNGTLIQTFSGHSDGINSVSFSPDGQTIAASNRNGMVQIWRLDGNLLQTFKSDSNWVNSVNFSPDGKMLVAGSGDGTVKLWHLDGTLGQTFKGHGSRVSSVSFSPDGQIIASGSGDGTVKLWHLESSLVQTLEAHNDQITSVSFSPDSQVIASASFDGTVKLWHLDGTLIQTFQGHSGKIYSISFSPNGQKIVSGSGDVTVKLWRLDGTLIQTFQGHSSGIYSVSFSSTGQMIASASFDGMVKLWHTDGVFPKTFQGHSSGIYSVSFSPNGQMIASASFDGTAKLWHTDGMLIQTFEGHGDWVSSVSFSPDSQMLASSSYDGTVKLWRLDGTELQTFQGHSGGITSVSFSPDGQILASASSNGTLKLWRLDGTELQTFRGHSNWVSRIGFSPDGQILASASRDSTVKLWHLDGKLVYTFQGNGNWISSVSFSPDGQTLASAIGDGTVKLWCVDGTELKTFQGHGNWVNSVNFSPDGQTLASASGDGTVKLWCVDGTELQTFQGHGNWVYDVCFSPDGQTFATASHDGTIKVMTWNLNLDDLLWRGCNWLRDYLKTNPNVSESDRLLCEDIGNNR